jgi:hypothetical protein
MQEEKYEQILEDLTDYLNTYCEYKEETMEQIVLDLDKRGVLHVDWIEIY